MRTLARALTTAAATGLLSVGLVVPAAAAPDNKNTGTSSFPCSEETGGPVDQTFVLHAPNPLIWIDGRVLVQTAYTFDISETLHALPQDVEVDLDSPTLLEDLAALDLDSFPPLLPAIVNEGSGTIVPAAHGGTWTCAFGEDFVADVFEADAQWAEDLGVEEGTLILVRVQTSFTVTFMEPGQQSGRR